MSCQDNEYICLTCVVNESLETLIAFEPEHKSSFIPMQIRRTYKMGIIFTNNSLLYDQHVVNGKDHKWGKYEDMLEEKKKSLNIKDHSL